jgi:predicted Zn finger-like uncharacterized protein
MVEYLRIPCPNCQHVLRVRKQYIGIEVTCTRCDHSFVVQEPTDDVATSPNDAEAASRAAYEKQITELKSDLDRVREDFARLASENSHAAEQLQKLTERYSEREAKLSELERSLNDSQDVIRQSESLIRLESIDIPDSIDLPQDPELPQLAQDIRRLTAERNQLL